MKRSKIALIASLFTIVIMAIGIYNSSQALSDESINSALTEGVSAAALRDFLMVLYAVVYIFQLITLLLSLLGYFKNVPGLMMAALLFSISGILLAGLVFIVHAVLLGLAIKDVKKVRLEEAMMR